MARFFKNRIFWFIVYGVFITCVFLYLLFPSELVKPDLEAAASSADYAFRTKTLRLSLPLGVKLGEASVYAPPSSPNAVFHGKWLDAQLLPWSVLGKIRQLRFKGEAYGGRFSGNAGLLAMGSVGSRFKFGNFEVGGFERKRGVVGQFHAHHGTSTAVCGNNGKSRKRHEREGEPCGPPSPCISDQ